jgi:hypothetical protein
LYLVNRILIIYPHWPPSNLAGVHRPRLIANFLPEFGWQPVVLTVDSKYYEEKPDPNLQLTVADHVERHYSKAWKVGKPRLIGDIGLRAFPFLYKKAKEIIKEQKIDFIWIPIPSFYMALMGRLLYRKFKIPYGIDYIDPWVRDISGRRDFRHITSNWLARLLEPIAVKKASLITGVSEGYYLPLLKRNFPKLHRLHKESENGNGSNKQINKTCPTTGGSTNQQINTIAFPYGFDPNDHKISLKNIDLPWKNILHCKPIVYAGAFLPKSRYFLQCLFAAIKQLKDNNEWNSTIHFFFLGTGQYPGKSIMEYAREYQLEDIVHENRNRYSFLHILNILKKAFGVMVIGSTEPHYTASKVYQAVLSGNPVLSIFHQQSSAYQVLQEVKADHYTIGWQPEMKEEKLIKQFKNKMKVFTNPQLGWQPDIELLVSARQSSMTLAKAIDQIQNKNS